MNRLTKEGKKIVLIVSVLLFGFTGRGKISRQVLVH